MSNSPSHLNRRAALIAWIKRNRGKLLLWLRVVITVGLMAFVIALVSRDGDKLAQVNWRLIPFAWLLMLVSTAVKAFRWGLLVRQSKMEITFRRLLGSYLVAAFFSTVLPSSVGGDAVRAVDTASSTGRVADSTSSVLIERGIGLLTVIGAGSMFALFLDASRVPLPFLLVIHAMFAAGIAGLVILRYGWLMGPIEQVMKRLKLGKMITKVRSLQSALSGHLGRPVVLGQMFALSIVANTLTMGAVYLVLVAVTHPVPVAAFVPMIALATTAELIPISIASLGVKESAYVFFLGLIGLGSVEAGVIAIIMRGLTWGHALLGGIVFFARTVKPSADKPAQAS